MNHEKNVKKSYQRVSTTLMCHVLAQHACGSFVTPNMSVILLSSVVWGDPQTFYFCQFFHVTDFFCNKQLIEPLVQICI